MIYLPFFRFFLPSPWGIVEIYPPTVMKLFFGLMVVIFDREECGEDYCFSVSEILRLPLHPNYTYKVIRTVYTKMKVKSKDFNSRSNWKQRSARARL